MLGRSTCPSTRPESPGPRGQGADPGPQPEPEGAGRADSADEGPRPGGGGGGERRKEAAKTLLLRNQNSRRRNPGSRRVRPASCGAMLEEGSSGSRRDRVLELADYPISRQR
ncbi:hypothetical protein NN561_019763 [Cricetulus griseus]